MSALSVGYCPPTGRMKSPLQDTVAALALKKDRATSREKEGIHSGHFMVSRVNENTSGDYLSDEEQELDRESDQGTPKAGFNFQQANRDTCKVYKFGNRSTQTLAIDESLSGLFKKLTLAYTYVVFSLQSYFSRSA